MELVAERVQKKAQGTKRYDNWIDSCLAFKGTAREKAINWRILEIKIERNKKKAQRQLIDAPLSMEADSSATREAAELFLSREFRLPYYFGFSKLVKMSSLNIEQFLVLASDLFEEVISPNY